MARRTKEHTKMSHRFLVKVGVGQCDKACVLDRVFAMRCTGEKKIIIQLLLVLLLVWLSLIV